MKKQNYEIKKKNYCGKKKVVCDKYNVAGIGKLFGRYTDML